MNLNRKIEWIMQKYDVVYPLGLLDELEKLIEDERKKLSVNS